MTETFEYLTPAGYINETDTRQYLLPNGVYLNETVEEAAGGTNHHFLPLLGAA